MATATTTTTILPATEGNLAAIASGRLSSTWICKTTQGMLADAGRPGSIDRILFDLDLGWLLVSVVQPCQRLVYEEKGAVY
ncbi:hypothetical protein BAE44_0026354 [Dichanthelium oligosanthes]|uniref:Uncharacterized protein n=1 Tax=Dichanthelium oligosanthes TaxID=888268 RepID=A0A1E5UIH8_9POAL|nr:hypothetical protein BAE44_0026354 [Dichanthelium oligosanthes]